ncbi:MAG: tetratricopeptide repeat protein [Armatimonadota bacterium]|nr:tetratricopeptide repeat protein [bacterium]MDW8320607.1 tetratricopeptide repeat protein [Armatimonadota bacterium]
MQNPAKRALVLAVIGLLVIAGVFGLRQAGLLRSAQERANEEFALSDMAHHEGDPESAIRHMQNAVRLDPHFVEAREGLAALYDQHRGMDAAVAEYERAIREDPQNEARYCYRIAQIYFLYRQWEPALQWARRAYALQPGDHHVQRIIGFCLERQGKWQEAEQHWSSLLEKNADDPNIRRGLERVRRHLNNTKQHSGKGG